MGYFFQRLQSKEKGLSVKKLVSENQLYTIVLEEVIHI